MIAVAEIEGLISVQEGEEGRINISTLGRWRKSQYQYQFKTGKCVARVAEERED